MARGLVASGLVMLIAVAGLSVRASGTLTPPLADAEAVLGLPDRIAAPSQHLRVSDAPGPVAAVIGAATRRTRLGEETLPVVISRVDGTAAFVRTPGARLDEEDVPVGLSLSPDGRYLAYEVEAARSTLAVLDLVEGGRQTFGFADTFDDFPLGLINDVLWSTTPEGDRLVWAQPGSPDEFAFPMPVLLVGNLSTGRKILARESVTRWRRRRWREVVTDVLPEPPATGNGVTGTVSEREDLRRALLRLAPRQRAVNVLRYYDDLTEVQTASVLGISVGTVKSHARDGLARLCGTDLLGPPRTHSEPSPHSLRE